MMILVTGGSGFIGRYVVNKLVAEGRKVLVVTRNKRYMQVPETDNVTIVETSLANIEDLISKLQDYDIKSCIHLAWEGIPDYSYEMSSKNLQYGLNILKICKRFGVKNLVITGSCWEYRNPEGSISVNSEIDYSNAFKAAKNSLHMMAHAFCVENGIHLNWMRLFYVYGPGQRSGSLIPHIIKCFEDGKQPELNGAYNENDFVYVEDAADAIVRCTLNHSYPETLNVGSGHATRVLDIVKMIAEEYDMPFDSVAYEKRSGVSYYADGEEIKDTCGWKANVDMNTGIKNMIKEARKIKL